MAKKDKDEEIMNKLSDKKDQQKKETQKILGKKSMKNEELVSKKISKDTKKKIKVKKEEKEKINFRETIEEFPIKMIKETNKIKWPESRILTKKYIIVILFMAIFAIFFVFIDWGLQALFTLIKVV